MEYDEHKFLLDPYILGVWLGKGVYDSTEISTDNVSIIDYFYDYANINNLKINTNDGHNYMFCASENNINTFMNALLDYNLINNKHIPDDYLYNSKK